MSVSDSAVRELRSLLARRQAIINSLNNHFADRIRIERMVLSRRRPATSYPDYLKPHLGKVDPPVIFVNGRLVWHGSFPAEGHFKEIVEKALAKGLNEE